MGVKNRPDRFPKENSEVAKFGRWRDRPGIEKDEGDVAVRVGKRRKTEPGGDRVPSLESEGDRHWKISESYLLSVGGVPDSYGPAEVPPFEKSKELFYGETGEGAVAVAGGIIRLYHGDPLVLPEFPE